MDIRYNHLKMLIFEDYYAADVVVSTALQKGLYKLTDAQFRRVQNAEEQRKALRQIIVKAGLLSEYLDYELRRNHERETNAIPAPTGRAVKK